MVLFFALLTLVPADARANPMLDLCLPVAPKACGLTDRASREDFLKCFEGVELRRSQPAEKSCAEELLHAKVHAACDEADIPKICGTIKPGGNRTMACLNNNHAKLTKACAGALDHYNDFGGSDKKRRKGHSGVAATRC